MYGIIEIHDFDGTTEYVSTVAFFDQMFEVINTGELIMWSLRCHQPWLVGQSPNKIGGKFQPCWIPGGKLAPQMLGLKPHPQDDTRLPLEAVMQLY